jgi:hypothetical protein
LRISGRIAKIHFTIFSEILSVSFGKSDYGYEIDILNITPRGGPPSDGGRPVPKPEKNCGPVLVATGPRRRQGPLEEEVDDIAACAEQRSSADVSVHEAVCGHAESRMTIQKRFQTWSLELNKFISRRLLAPASSSTRDHRSCSERTLRPFGMKKESFVQCSSIKHLAELKASEIGRQKLSNELIEIIARFEKRRRDDAYVYFFGAQCYSSEDSSVAVIVRILDQDDAELIFKSNSKKDNAEALLASALSDLNKFGVRSVHIKCNGRAPFVKNKEISERNHIAVLREAFDLHSIVERNKSFKNDFIPDCEFVLNKSGFAPISDYYAAALERFEAGVPRSDAFVWKELAFWLRRHGKPKLFIVLREFSSEQWD